MNDRSYYRGVDTQVIADAPTTKTHRGESTRATAFQQRRFCFPTHQLRCEVDQGFSRAKTVIGEGRDQRWEGRFVVDHIGALVE